MKTRLIIQSHENGGNESVFFTQDLETNVEEFLYLNNTVDYDVVIDVDLPVEFPLDRQLQVQ